MHKLILFLKRRQISNRQNVFFFTFPVDKMKCKFQVSYCNFLNNKLTINFLGHELYGEGSENTQTKNVPFLKFICM